MERQSLTQLSIKNYLKKINHNSIRSRKMGSRLYELFKGQMVRIIQTHDQMLNHQNRIRVQFLSQNCLTNPKCPLPQFTITIFTQVPAYEDNNYIDNIQSLTFLNCHNLISIKIKVAIIQLEQKALIKCHPIYKFPCAIQKFNYISKFLVQMEDECQKDLIFMCIIVKIDIKKGLTLKVIQHRLKNISKNISFNNQKDMQSFFNEDFESKFRIKQVKVLNLLKQRFPQFLQKQKRKWWW